MPKCPSYDDCPYRSTGKPSRNQQHALGPHYCFEEPEGCARYLAQHALGYDRVPRDLGPHNHERARRLITIG